MVVDSELDMILSDLFDKYGNCDSLGDPFRGEPTDVQKVIFKCKCGTKYSLLDLHLLVRRGFSKCKCGRLLDNVK